MATTEQFSLRWNNFHSNLTTGFHDLLQAAEMVDVTLAVDGHFLQAHKIVLSICSPYFRQMFKVNPCKHPIVILRDVSHENIKDILQFMYQGEVSVLRDNLTSFLRTAELLQVKGLTGDDSNDDPPERKDAVKPELDNINDEDNEMYNQLIETTDVELPQYGSIPPQPTPMSHPLKRTSKTASSNANGKKIKSEVNCSSQSKPLKDCGKSEIAKPKIDYKDYNNCDFPAVLADTYNANVSERCGSDGDETKEKPGGGGGNIWDNNVGNVSGGNIDSSDQGRSDLRLFRHVHHQCEHCLKRFSRRDHLRTHEKNIHGSDAGPFKCIICEQLYKNTESLRKHISKFHFSNINDLAHKVEVKV